MNEELLQQYYQTALDMLRGAGQILPSVGRQIGADMANWHRNVRRDVANPFPEGSMDRMRGALDAPTQQMTPEQWTDALATTLDMMPGFGGVTKSFRGQFGINKGDVPLKDPKRAAYPKLYAERPDALAAAAARNTAPENPALREVFGVGRDELYEMHRGRGPMDAPAIVMPAKPKGAAAGRQIMTKANRERLINTLGEAGEFPELYKGMDAWYEMQPLYDILKQISDKPKEDFWKFQNFTGMASPGTPVDEEISRGTAALMLANKGRFDDFVRWGGGQKGGGLAPGAPADMAGTPGHVYHKTAQSKPMQDYVDTGELQMKSPKVPLYIQSAGVPETGYQATLPVGDAHFSRGVGLADVRGAKDYGASISTPELLTIGDWWRDIAGEVGLNPVQAQARMWGTLAPVTGVKTKVGTPKLELIAQKVKDAAQAYGIPVEQARDMLLTGQIFAPKLKDL